MTSEKWHQGFPYFCHRVADVQTWAGWRRLDVVVQMSALFSDVSFAVSPTVDCAVRDLLVVQITLAEWPELAERPESCGPSEDGLPGRRSA